MTPELTLLYTHSDQLGYGRLGVKLAESLRGVGVDVYERLGETLPWQGHLADLPAEVTNTVCTVSYPSHLRGWYQGQRKVAFTMFETTRLPEAFVETMHEYDLIVVPSQQNVELFSQYHPNVKLCLLGIDTDDWRFTKRTPPGRFFDFLIGGSGPRKGTDLAFEAFNKVFSTWPADGPIPRLIMKNPVGEAQFFGDRIRMVRGRISLAEEVSLYASAHCYLQPSRGEGFGLQPLQAITQGLPTILTDAHGHQAFSHLGYGIGAELAPAGYFMIGEAGEWWEPNLDELCDRMLWVYDHYDEACTFAEASAVEAAARFPWRRTAEAFVDAVGVDTLTAPYEGSMGWEEPTPRLFRIVTNRDYYCEVAGFAHQFTKGVEAWDTADVKRILMDTGVLDPVCVSTLDLGVDEAQVDAYTTRHSFCPHCGQRLGSGVTRADELFQQLEEAAR